MPLRLATAVGRITLSRQVCTCHRCGRDFLPLNRVLPQHQGVLLTRGLQELACLVALGAPYAPTAEVLRRVTHDPAVLSPRQVEDVVGDHGQQIRAHETAQAQDVLTRPGSPAQPTVLLPLSPPRRDAAWPEAVARAVEAALNAQAWETCPEGVAPADWARIVQRVRSQPQVPLPLQQVARLGPQLQPDEVLLTLDGILLGGRSQGSRLEVRIARLATISGYRYLSGLGDAFLEQVQAALLALDGPSRRLIVLADGARWIRDFIAHHLGAFPHKEVILDWYHLTKKCKELLSMVVRGRQQRREVLRRVMPRLWEGQVDAALTAFRALQGDARHPDKLAELISYLEKHRGEIPDYKQRRLNGQYNGSGSVEKACDLLVARRQKRKGMHWVERGADALCALQTLWHNRGWDRYWKFRQVLPLVGPLDPLPCAC